MGCNVELRLALPCLALYASRILLCILHEFTSVESENILEMLECYKIIGCPLLNLHYIIHKLSFQNWQGEVWVSVD